MAGNDDLLDMPPNQLRICLMRARELPVMDVAEGLPVAVGDPLRHSCGVNKQGRHEGQASGVEKFDKSTKV